MKNKLNIEKKEKIITEKLKLTTEIPESITMPDKVKTSIGTLEFFDGFPSQETVGS